MNDAEARDRPFLDTGLDFSSEAFEPEEKAALLAWYEEVHSYGHLDLAPFARFWIDHDPGGFKRLKRHPVMIRRAVQMARALDVRRHQVVSALFWATVAGGSLALEQAYAAAEDVLDDLT